MRIREPVGILTHLRWYRRALGRRSKTRQFIALAGGEPVGLGRLYFHDSVVELGVIVDPFVRGRGVGSAIISALVKKAHWAGAEVLIAYIRRDNPASFRAFKKAGFIRRPVLEQSQRNFSLMQWSPPRSDVP